ncbi:MAG: TetR/AcrR family transcriptional regulator [Thermodesulfobacteriota bacterium]|nr:TetR/AcrR family transcriptional regulator [Thermodesulfobacteriota bacterium]
MFKELREKEKQTRQQLIVDTAESIFQTKGHEAITIRKVADKVGVSAGTIYTYFKDKEEMLLCVLLNNLEQLASKMKKSLQIDDPIACILSLANDYKEYYQRFGRFADVVNYMTKKDSDSVSESFQEQLRQRVLNIFSMLEKRLEEPDMAQIRKNLPSNRAAIILWAAIQGVSQVTLPSAIDPGVQWFQFDKMVNDMLIMVTETETSLENEN